MINYLECILWNPDILIYIFCWSDGFYDSSYDLPEGLASMAKQSNVLHNALYKTHIKHTFLTQKIMQKF